jgi:hypothetical protein
VLLDRIEQGGAADPLQGAWASYFVTQNPLDVPDVVLGTSATASSTRCAQNSRARPEGGEDRRADDARELKIDTEKAITELGVGEALISFLDERAAPPSSSGLWDAARLTDRPDHDGRAQRGAGRVAGQGHLRRPSTASRPTKSSRVAQ